MKATELLFKYQDEVYKDFQSKLTPTIPKEKFIGVKVPNVRIIAKDYIKDEEHIKFFNSLPHNYYDENMLHGVLISEIKDYNECMKELEKFLPYVDNWAVCDIMSPKIFKKHKEDLLEKIKKWVKDTKTYTIRFGIEMLQSHYLDQDFKEEYLKIPNIKSNDYYVNMMIAWFYATSLTKQWDSTIKIIENKELSVWTHNKTIQKACESYRITDEQKIYLKSLKIKEK